MATDCNPNSRAKEVFHLIIVITSSLVWANVVVAPSVTAKVEASKLVCDSTLLTEVVLPGYTVPTPMVWSRGRGAGKC